MSTNEMEYPNPGMPWWLVLIEGIIAIIVGILLFTNSAATLIFLVTFLGVYWLITGIINLISLFWNRSSWGWKLFTGFLGIIAGLMIIMNPLVSTIVVPAAFALVLGILGVVMGISMLIQAFTGEGWGVGVLGALSIVLGVILITRPLVAGFTLAFLLGFLMIFGGIIALISSFSLRRMNAQYRQMETQASYVPPQTAAAAVPVTGAAMAETVDVIEDEYDTAAMQAEDTVEDFTSEAAGTVDAGSDTAKQTGEDITKTVTGKAADVYDEAEDTARQTGENITDEVDEVTGKASDVYNEAKDSARQTGEDVERHLDDDTDEEYPRHSSET